MMWLHIVLLVCSGVLAISDAIVARRPDAKALIDRLVPLQALLGLGLLASGIVLWLRFGLVDAFRWLGHAPLFGVTLVGMIGSGLMLGFFFGMPQLAKWIPGESSAEAAALRWSQKLASIKLVAGAVALVAAILGLLFALGMLDIAVVVAR